MCKQYIEKKHYEILGLTLGWSSIGEYKPAGKEPELAFDEGFESRTWNFRGSR